MAGILAASCALSQAPKKQMKDQAEYDLFTGITKETDNNKKLSLLNTWKTKYENTDYKQERLQLYLTTYQGLGQPAKMIETAKEMLALDPKDIQGLYWITFLTPQMNSAAADALDLGQKAAEGLLSAEKPATTDEAAWKTAKAGMDVLAHKTLGWIPMQRKDPVGAEKAFAKSLALNPNQGEISYWLGTVILQQKKTERYAEAFFHFARAASDGPGGLPTPQGRKQIDDYWVKLYTSFHGKDDAGAAEIRTMAKASHMPPADFKIKNVHEIASENEEKFKASNPQLALWLGLKKELVGENSAGYWESGMKGAALPKLKGTVISQKPAANAKELVIGIENAANPEVTLKLEKPLPGKFEENTVVEFEGVPAEFTKEPFMVTMDVEDGKLTGWTGKVAAPAKRPAAKKGAAKGAAKK